MLSNITIFIPLLYIATTQNNNDNDSQSQHSRLSISNQKVLSTTFDNFNFLKLKCSNFVHK